MIMSIRENKRIFLSLLCGAEECQGKANRTSLGRNLIGCLNRIAKGQFSVVAFVVELDHIDDLVSIHALKVNRVYRLAKWNLSPSKVG